MAFACRQRRASFADDGRVPVGQRRDEAIEPCRPSSVANFILPRVGPRVANVLRDCGVKHARLLLDERNTVPQVVERQIADVPAIHPNRAFVRIEQTKKQVRDGRFPAAARSDDGQRFAWRDRERNVLQHLTASPIERHPIELYITGETRQP